MPGKVEKKNILHEASLFLEENREELASKVVKYYKRYIPAYSSFSSPDFLEEVREEILERITLMARYLVDEKEIEHLSSEFFKKLTERRLVQGIPFSELLGAYVVGKKIIINALKREFLARELEKEEIVQFFQTVGEATESILIPMAFTYEDTQEYLDHLTRCFTHSYFQEALCAELEKAEEENTPVSLSIIDIDHFRQFNETYGYRHCDSVLREISQLLTDRISTDDIIARFSGDKFAVIMLRRPKGQALKTAQKIRKVIAGHDFYIHGCGTKKMTVSIGVATFPDDAGTRSELVEKCMATLARAKQNGINTVATGKNKLQG